MKLFKKKNWAFYLFMLCVFSLAFFLADWLINKHNPGNAAVGGIISGVIMTVLWWFFDQAHEQIQPTALRYPSTTSITIIRTKPMAKPMVDRLVCSPCAVSGISSSTTTYIIAPAANASR